MNSWLSEVLYQSARADNPATGRYIIQKTRGLLWVPCKQCAGTGDLPHPSIRGAFKTCGKCKGKTGIWL